MLEWFNGEEFSIDKNGYESVSWRNDGSPEGFDEAEKAISSGKNFI